MYDISEKTAASDHLISLSGLCQELSVSTATGRNWLKLGKLAPTATVSGAPYFSAGYVKELKKSLQTGGNTALKSRRNKKYISGNGIYSSYVSETSSGVGSVQAVLEAVSAMALPMTWPLMECLLSDCALQMFIDSGYFDARSKADASLGRPVPRHLPDYLDGSLILNEFDILIGDILPDKEKVKEITAAYPELFRIDFHYEAGEDILGFLYLSLKSMGERKAAGVYYTPTAVVKKLCSGLFPDSLFSVGKEAPKTILDPCCGTGNFLLQLPDDIPFDMVYGNDIDPLSVKLARINMALKYGIHDYSLLCGHITAQDYLEHRFSERFPGHFDYILGNPPWGYDFKDTEKRYLRNHYVCAAGTNIESYDLFVEQALSELKPGGCLSFVLPEAILNVKSHAPIRALLMKSNSIRSIEYLGNVFDQVQCPCIILQVQHTGIPMSCIGMKVTTASDSFTIQRERKIHAGCFSFLTSDEEYSLLEKISHVPDRQFLAGNAVFALGIVTGNNQKYLSETDAPDNEPVLRGSDLRRYRVMPPKSRINFRPEQFQQAAPAEYYRAPEKLLYRFICSHLVFAYDDRQTLSLNSCNLLIPQIPGMDIKYIMAVLNSRTAQFYFHKKFRSVKVLRSHLEQIPIPKAEKERQEDILTDVECLLAANETYEIEELFDKIDQKVAILYGLTSDEYRRIRQSLTGENLFLR